MRRTSHLLLASTCLVALVTLASSPSSAMEHALGDFYAYEVRTELMGLTVTGDLTYEFVGTDTVSLDGVDYDVNVMSVSGTLTGGVMTVDLVSATVDGTAFETKQGSALVKEEVSVLANLTFGTGQFAQVYTIVEEVSSTQSPPLLSEFNPSSAALGDEWSETVTVRAENRTWLNGAPWGDPVWMNETIRYDVSIADETDAVVTKAGTFDCMKISAQNDSGDSFVLWWSLEVGNFVSVHVYSEGESEPSATLELTNYRHDEPTDLLFIIGVGGAVLAIAIIVLVAVLIIMRREASPPETYGPDLQLDHSPDEESQNRRDR